jgi:hypothetical protein
MSVFFPPGLFFCPCSFHRQRVYKISMVEMRTKKLIAVFRQLKELYAESKFKTRHIDHSTMIIKDGDQFWGWVDDDGTVDPSLQAKLSKD